MITGVPAFYSENKQDNTEVFQVIRDGEWRERFNQYCENPSTNLVDIIEHCLIVEPSERIGISDIINHTFF